jgi:hypothetical protein
VDEAAQKESMQLSLANDELGLEKMESQGRIFVVEQGTQALLLEGGFMTARVRILSGKYRGEAGYLPVEFIQ